MVVPTILLIDIYPSRLTCHRTRRILLAVVLASWVVPAILLIDIFPSHLTRYRTCCQGTDHHCPHQQRARSISLVIIIVSLYGTTLHCF